MLFGAIAAAALSIAVTDSAQAGAKEAKALALALSPKTVDNAEPADLAAAVATVITNNPKFKPGIVAGEALKTPAAVSKGAGSAIAAVFAEAADRVGITADAAKTAGTGKGSNSTQVDEFAKITIQTDLEAVQAAEKAKASKLGAAAIIQGRADSYTTDAGKIALTSSAVGNKKLIGLATEISAAGSVGISDPSAFTIAVTNAANAVKAGNGVKVAPGVVASNPEQAALIVQGLFASGDTKIAKQAAALAKSVGAVADVEQISNVALVLGRQIAGGSIKVTAAAGLAKTLTAAIVAKTTLAGTRLSIENKADEVAEVAAFIVGGLVSNSAVLTEKTGSKILLAIIKSAIAGGKAKKGQTALAADYIADIAGSVARTIKNSALSSTLKDKIEAELGLKAKTIAGKANEQVIQAALTAGFADDARYEDGATYNTDQRDDPAHLFVVDPETDHRGFTGTGGQR